MTETVIRRRPADRLCAFEAPEPHISREALGLRHSRDRRACTDDLNSPPSGHGLAGLGVEDLIRRVREVGHTGYRKYRAAQFDQFPAVADRALAEHSFRESSIVH